METYNIVNDANFNNSELLEKLKKYRFELESALVIDSKEENLDFTDADISSKLIEKFSIAENRAKNTIKYLIVLDADDISKEYSNMKGLYEHLDVKDLSILLVTSFCLEKHHNSFNDCFYYLSNNKSLFTLRNDIKRKNKGYTAFQKNCVYFIPRFATFERYTCKNKEVSKFYENLMKKEVFVATAVYKDFPQHQVTISSCDEPLKPEWDSYKKSGLNQFIRNKDELTFVISDEEDFTIKIPSQLFNFDKFLLKDDANFIKFLSFLYGKYGDNFLFQHKNNPELSEDEQIKLENGLDEELICYRMEKNIKEELDTFLASQTIDLSKYTTIENGNEKDDTDLLIFNRTYNILDGYSLFFNNKEINYRKGLSFSFSLLIKNEIDMNIKKITKDNMSLLIAELPNSLDYSLLKLEENSEELKDFKDGMARGFKDYLTLRKENGAIGLLNYEELFPVPDAK